MHEIRAQQVARPVGRGTRRHAKGGVPVNSQAALLHPPGMQVFADLRLSLVLVVPAGTLGETCALPDETSSAASVGRLRSTSEPESVCRRAVGNARPLSSARS